MGLLTNGTPFTWEELVPYIPYIKERGINQFINLYHLHKNRKDTPLIWGDEIEFTIVKFDHENKKVRVLLRSCEILEKLDKLNENPTLKINSCWTPEFGGYQIEGIPCTPYGNTLECIKNVEKNMRERRLVIENFLDKDETLLTFCFPSLGTPDFTYPCTKPNPDQLSRSIFISDEVLNCYNPRYKILMETMISRRGGKSHANIPVYKDKFTPTPFIEDFSSLNDETKTMALPEHIFMDHNVFGDGMCCLQVTIQGADEDQARCLYDQLTVFTPILFALSAATPIFRGYLAAVDTRWSVMCQISDDRTEAERNNPPIPNNPFAILKSRHDSTDCYLHPDSAQFNDIPLQYDAQYYQKLLDGGVDELLAKHIAHLFIRDPLQIYKERLIQDDITDDEHFETIQSSNWNNIRFKPPPLKCEDLGWRVEFRTMELQLTDFENAAYSCFLILLARVLLTYKLSFLLPISQVNENMKRSEKQDAVLNQKFYFRKNFANINENNHEIVEMTINEIINGNEKIFPGVIPIMRKYVNDSEVDEETANLIHRYLDLIQDRASGKIFTLAKWMRKFVKNHPDYKFDSHVKDSTIYDMIKAMHKISTGDYYDAKLLGPKIVLNEDKQWHKNGLILEKRCKEKIESKNFFNKTQFV